MHYPPRQREKERERDIGALHPVGVTPTKIVKFAARSCTRRVHAYRRGCTHDRERTIRARPEFTSLMYVLGGDRSLSHELLIVRRHNSPRVSHPLSVLLHPTPPPLPPVVVVDAARASSLISHALYKRVRNTRLCTFAGSDGCARSLISRPSPNLPSKWCLQLFAFPSDIFASGS